MKNQAIQYLALDVHQATVVATVRDQQGAIRMRATVPTEATAILGLVRSLGPRVHVAFEEGTQAQWLHDLLQPHAERVVVHALHRAHSQHLRQTVGIDPIALVACLDRAIPRRPSASARMTTGGSACR
jgi:hypothetical protein